MNDNPNYYQRKQTRKPNYNYSSGGLYFVTICTKNKQRFFGKVVNEKMILSPMGEIAEECWFDVENHFNGVHMNKFVIMPDHVHGIITIIHGRGAKMRPVHIQGHNIYEKDNQNLSPQSVGDAFLHPSHDNKKIDRSKMLLPKIVHGFKSSVTRRINQIEKNIQFGWQRSFHDRIIWNENHLMEINEYMVRNPNPR